MIEQFRQFFKKHHIDIKHGRFLLAVSGGIDSVVLVELSRQAGLSFAIVHCNFGLRGAESERDEAFVQALAKKTAVPFFIKKFETQQMADSSGLSIQEAARNLRYDWFGALQKEENFDYTLLAHHADDNIETLLMNFFRGTGLNGLTGIPEKIKKSGHYLRPMLGLRRSRIAAFAAEHGLQWAEDSSNASTKYTRNFFRHELLPQVKEIYPSIDKNLLANIERFRDISAFYNEHVHKLKEALVEKKGDEARIPVKKLLQYNNKAIIYELIKDYGFGEAQLPDVIHLLSAASGRFISNNSYQIIRHGVWLLIVPNTEEGATIAIDDGINSVAFSGGTIMLTKLPVESIEMDSSPAIALLDAEKISYPIVLRQPKPGDYFYPLGMPKKKKLARFFIDARLSKRDKEMVWVLESAGRIVWIIGMRIDDRCKLRPATKQVLRISYQPKNL